VDTNGNPLVIAGVPAFTSTRNTTSSIISQQAGYGDSLDLLRRFAFPTYGVSLSLNIPVLNRAAQAANVRAQLEQKQAEANYQKLQNSIVVEVRNAQIGLEQNRARVQAAIKARELAEQTLDAEQKKYQLGASTIFFVIQAQRDLAAAQSTEVSALVSLTLAQVEYDRALGRTLDVNKISVAEAEKGLMNKAPLIPGTPTAELLGEQIKY
jgi:outer membrane protein TolC